MKTWMTRAVALVAVVAAAGCAGNAAATRTVVEPVREAGRDVGVVRFAVFNASLNRSREGELVEHLRGGADEQIRNVAEVVQRVRPDVLLVNEFDYEPTGDAVRLFREKYLAVSQRGQKPIEYPYAYVAPVNTGVPSGHDLDRNGRVVSAPGERAYGNDCFGFGEFPGQYGMLVLSRYPIEAERVRTFQTLRWDEMPGAMWPTVPATGEAWYPAEARGVMRLSSKSHWDVPVRVPGGGVVHVLAAHPTPPAFDGPEDRNGKRNHDEIRLWADYLTGGAAASYIRDDRGGRGGISNDARFVILGDYNADPNDGGSVAAAIGQLLDHPRVAKRVTPTSIGAREAAAQGGANTTHRTPAEQDTADFSEPNPGNLRVDYALPSANLKVVGTGVFWPATKEDGADLMVMRPKAATSDHRLVWVDVKP